VPKALLDQLKVGGRLVAIEGQEPVMRAMLYTRHSPEAVARLALFDTLARELDGFEPPTRFHF
jgi:protein-L-isoaspartate(D-aspartate) O-methyltransferase